MSTNEPYVLKSSHFYLIGFCLLAGCIYTAQRMGLPLPWWINNHVNDFLCMPIVLFICQYSVRKLKAEPAIQLSLPLILCVTLYYALFFEYYLPKVNPRYTADFWDVVLYFLGALFFYRMEKVKVAYTF
ncbi:hypothetical protein RQM65_14515 [Pricia sp. S334]|uniref:Magnesium citrate secondary transporter n=1 Tax=Pricia mediterranea TaxID=3076079 RepID=A0ABU3L9K7_9FLAO|nr:hypothetical protein [Pricia sp. S334]MDT7829884.1 hypothetical protein [Pricia sp. S334]